MFRAALLLALLAALVAGCGASTSTAPAAHAPATTTSSATTATTASPSATGASTEQPQGSPADFVQTVIDDDLGGKAGRAWELMHPALQDMVPKELFTSCQQENARALPDDLNVETGDVYPDTMVVPGLGRRPTQAVTVTIRAGGQHLTTVMHAIPYQGRWTWTPDRQTLAAYKAGRCRPPQRAT